MLEDKDRIFQNLYNDFGADLSSAKNRGDWKDTKEICEKGFWNSLLFNSENKYSVISIGTTIKTTFNPSKSEKIPNAIPVFSTYVKFSIPSITETILSYWTLFW